LRVLRRSVHCAPVAIPTAKVRKVVKRANRGFTHLDDVLSEGALLAPILGPLLTFSIAMFAMEEEQREECCNHTTEDPYGTNNIHPGPNCLRGPWSAAADTGSQAVEGSAFFVSRTAGGQLFHPVANKSLGVTVKTILAVVTGDNIEEFLIICTIGDIRRILNRTILTLRGILVLALIVQAYSPAIARPRNGRS